MFQFVPGVDKFWVVGNPIAHSKSPRIHAEFARQTGQNLAYHAALVPVGEFRPAIAEFRRLGGRGLSVTLPFKQEACQICDHPSRQVRLCGAANTLWFGAAGQIHGDNTDGTGLVRDLVRNLGVAVSGRRVLLVGGGGAARGVVPALLAERPSGLTIVNRTASRARAIAELFDAADRVSGGGYDLIANDQYDLIINATAASLQGEIPPLSPDIIGHDAWCYDMMYANRPTPFVDWALQHGARGAADGLGMLVEQAAEAFYIWRGVRPETDAVIGSLRAEL
jgi:shikimate dehydrogenase